MARCSRCQFRDPRRWYYCPRCGAARHWQHLVWSGHNSWVKFWVMLLIVYYCMRHMHAWF